MIRTGGLNILVATAKVLPSWDAVVKENGGAVAQADVVIGQDISDSQQVLKGEGLVEIEAR